MTTPASLLPACTLRIDIGGVAKGTAFFVAPGLLVTCSHVTEAHRLVGSDSPIIVVDQTGTSREVDVVADEPDAQVDLAILKLRHAEDHPCVLLDSELEPFDDLYTYGYTEKYPEGSSTTLSSEGPMGNHWCKLKGGQVQPGMSGSPLLNERTGGVCAILKRSRDARSPAGGYAVSIDALAKLDARCKKANEGFHRRRREWLGVLEPDRQQLLRSSWGALDQGTQSVTYFVLTIGSATQGHGWQVRARIEPGGEVIAAVDVDLNVVRVQVALLFRDWASRGRVSPEAEQVRLLGSILYGAVFPAQIGERFEQLTARGAGNGRVGVALRFDEDVESDLMHLPWEHLYRPRRLTDAGMQLATERSVSFVRTSGDEPSDETAPDSSRLSVLVVAIERRRIESIRTVVEKLEAAAEKSSALTVRVIDTPTPLELEDALEGIDVLHYVGLGRFRDGADEIALGDEFGDLAYVSIDTIADSLRASRLRLAVLEPCAGDKEAVAADFAVLAPTLLDDVPAVLAFQFPLTADVTHSFNARLYELLSAGVTVDEAVQEARSKLRLSGRSFASPALWMRRPGQLRMVAVPDDLAARQQPLVASHG